MERRDHTTVATFYADEVLAAGRRIELGEAPAHHARVRRIEVGEAIRVTNGRGAIGTGTLERLTRDLAVVSVEEVAERPRPPHLRLFVPVADRDRMLWLAEKSAEIGVTAWQPVIFRRSASVSPRGEGEAFMRKARARMIAAIEQSNGAWLPE